MRELALGRTLSCVPSVMMSPQMMMSAATVPPPEPVVSADRRRLQDTLRLYELTERQVAGDGNCQVCEGGRAGGGAGDVVCLKEGASRKGL